MNPFDITIIIIISFCFIRGAFRGLVKEVSSIIGVMAGFYAAYTYYGDVAGRLADFVSSGPYLNIASFLILFVAVVIAVSALGVFIRYLLKIVFLGWLDRLCGGLFGFVKGYLIAAILLLVLTSFLDKGAPVVKESRLSPYVLTATETISGFVPEEMEQAFSSKIEFVKKEWQKKIKSLKK